MNRGGALYRSPSSVSEKQNHEKRKEKKNNSTSLEWCFWTGWNVFNSRSRDMWLNFIVSFTSIHVLIKAKQKKAQLSVLARWWDQSLESHLTLLSTAVFTLPRSTLDLLYFVFASRRLFIDTVIALAPCTKKLEMSSMGGWRGSLEKRNDKLVYLVARHASFTFNTLLYNTQTPHQTDSEMVMWWWRAEREREMLPSKLFTEKMRKWKR